MDFLQVFPACEKYQTKDINILIFWYIYGDEDSEEGNCALSYVTFFKTQI